MAKKVKAVDVKMVAKMDVMAVVAQALEDAGYAVADGKAFGMTAGTLVVSTDVTDIQLKPITPKTGIVRYELEVE